MTLKRADQVELLSMRGARKLRQVLQAPAVPVSLSIACAFNSEEQWMECLKRLASAQGRGDSGPNSMPAVQWCVDDVLFPRLTAG